MLTGIFYGNKAKAEDVHINALNISNESEPTEAETRLLVALPGLPVRAKASPFY